MLRKNKKGAIGPTLTWIVAFFIIFFALVGIYLPSTFFIASKEFVGGKKEIGVEFGEAQFLKTELLVYLLETQVDEVKLKDIIYDWAVRVKEGDELKDKIMQDVKSNLDLYEDCKYVFYVDAFPKTFTFDYPKDQYIINVTNLYQFDISKIQMSKINIPTKNKAEQEISVGLHLNCFEKNEK